MRLGLASLKEDVAPKHPVEVIQRESKKQADVTKNQMLRNLYGVAVPAKASIETQILDRFHRLPGLQSSKLGLESLTGALDEYGFESYLGLPEYSEELPVEMHAQMEVKLKLGTQPCERGFF